MAARAPEEAVARRKDVPAAPVLADAPGPPPEAAPASPRRMAAKMSRVEAMEGAGGGVYRVRSAPLAAPRSAGVTAGSSDDNLQFNAFLQFLRQHPGVALPHDISQRTIVEVRDAQGLPVHRAEVIVRDAQGNVVVRRRTYPDGRALVFEAGRIRVEYAGVGQDLPAQGPRQRQVQLDVRRREVQRVPLDVAFILDTTGSMQDEIDRLRQTLDVIHFQLTHLDPGADVRFGLVEYKDRGDEFVTRPIPFTSDIEAFRATLANVRAYGGGDEPEDVQAGLEQGLHALQWRDEAVKVAFLIGDAAPHLDYGEQFTYQSAMREAARRGIKIAAVGCSGLPLAGEVVWREIAQYTMGPYVFLSRGERGDMEGSASTVSHHVGSNWVAENLETIVVRLVKSEIAHLQPRLVAQQQDYFEARKGADLRDLFRQSVKQLIDYSVAPIDGSARAEIRPLQIKSGRLQPAAEKLRAQLEKSLPFHMVSDGAEIAIESQLAEDASGRPEMLIKLVRIETREMLSLSLLRIDPALL